MTVTMRLPASHNRWNHQRKRRAADVPRLVAPKCTVNVFRMESYAQIFALVWNVAMIANTKGQQFKDISQKLALPNIGLNSLGDKL